MQFIQGQPRQQTYFATLEDQVAKDNPVRLIDAFIEKLDLQKLGFNKTVHSFEGRPAYATQVLLKLYLCGYQVQPHYLSGFHLRALLIKNKCENSAGTKIPFS